MQKPIPDRVSQISGAKEDIPTGATSKSATKARPQSILTQQADIPMAAPKAAPMFCPAAAPVGAPAASAPPMAAPMAAPKAASAASIIAAAAPMAAAELESSSSYSSVSSGPSETNSDPKEPAQPATHREEHVIAEDIGEQPEPEPEHPKEPVDPEEQQILDDKDLSAQIRLHLGLLSEISLIPQFVPTPEIAGEETLWPYVQEEETPCIRKFLIRQ